MLASALASVLCLIALQVVLVIKVADWLSLPADRDLEGSRSRADHYAGLA